MSWVGACVSEYNVFWLSTQCGIVSSGVLVMLLYSFEHCLVC
jgi:hypothetical protein